MSISPRILIVRLGAMGDIVHALPVLAGLREQWPSADIDWLVEAKHRPLLDRTAGLSSIVAIESARVTGAGGWIDTVRRLRARRYDMAVDVQGLIKSAALTRLSGARRTIGFARAHARESLATRFYSMPVDPSPARHVIDRNLALARVAGVVNPTRTFPLRVPQPTTALTAFLATLPPSFIIVNPGAAWPNKRWPADRFSTVVARVHATRGLPSVITWGPGEDGLARAVAAGAPGVAVVAPRTSLDELLTLLSRATLVVAGDTGPLHLAAALRRPVVGIFGPTHAGRNGPWALDDICVSRSDQCECFHKRQCRAARWCLGDLGPDEVVDAVERRLLAARTGVAPR